MYSYQLTDNKLSVTRTDEDSGWVQYLIVYKFNSKYDLVVFNSYIFHREWVNHLFRGRWSN